MACGILIPQQGMESSLPALETCSLNQGSPLRMLFKTIIHQTVSKLGKKHIKAVYCQPAYLTYMQSTLCEMLDWMKHKLELRLPGEIPITSDMQMTPPLWQKVKN